MPTKRVPATLRVDWPVRPELSALDAREGVYAWARFKLWTADWYLERFDQLLDIVPRVQRQVGIEMAIDGILESLCSAVDAACAAVIGAAEVRRPPKKLTLEHRYTPELAVRRLREQGRRRAPKALEEARAGHNSSNPSGWFGQLGHLRNTVVHHSALGHHRLLWWQGRRQDRHCRPWIGPHRTDRLPPGRQNEGWTAHRAAFEGGGLACPWPVRGSAVPRSDSHRGACHRHCSGFRVGGG
jgi:hypothetical protein